MTSTRSAIRAPGAVLLRLLLRAAAVGGLLAAGWLLGSAPGHAVVPGTDTGAIGSGDESSLDAGELQLSETVQSTLQVTADTTDAVTDLAGSSSPAGTQPDHSTAAEPPSEPADATTEPAEPAETTAEPAEADAEPAEPEPNEVEPAEGAAEPAETDAEPAEPERAEPEPAAPELAEPDVELTDATAERPAAQPAEPVRALTGPVVDVTEPVTALAEPVTAVAEPVIQLAEPVTALAEPVIQLAEPVVELAGSVTDTSRRPAAVGPTVTAAPATGQSTPPPQPLIDDDAEAVPPGVVAGPHAAHVVSQPWSGQADDNPVVADTSVVSVADAMAALGGHVSPPCSSAGSAPAGTGGMPALPGGNGALTPPGPAVSPFVAPVAGASGLLAQRPSTSPD